MANFKTGGDQMGYESDQNRMLALLRAQAANLAALQAQVAAMSAKSQPATTITAPVYVSPPVTPPTSSAIVIGSAAGGDLTGTYPNPSLRLLAPSPAGTYTSANITIDGSGRVTTAATGTSSVPFVGSGAGHTAGLVPDPGATAGTSRFLCENGVFAVPLTGGTATARAAFRMVLLQGATGAGATGGQGQDVFPYADDGATVLYYTPATMSVRCETAPSSATLSASSEWSTGTGAFSATNIRTRTVSVGNREPTAAGTALTPIYYPKSGDKCRANIGAWGGAASVSVIQEFTVTTTNPGL